MPDQIRNEHIKLFANWTNTVATAILTVGVFTPLGIKFYGIGEPAKNADLLVYLPWFASAPPWPYIWVVSLSWN